jgi:hypothetical protein
MDGMRLSEEERGLVGLWAADCAERVLPLFEAIAPSDARPREAVDGIRAWARGDMRPGRLRTIAVAAHAAAREVDDPIAAAAARAAGSAAAAAFMHAPETIGTEKHCLGAAMYAARACELAAPDDPHAGDDEIRWAVEHASAAVREIVRGLPALGPAHGRLEVLLHELDASLRRP